MEFITTSALTKKYGPTLAVDEISLRVEEGEMYGFLGLNGAGKTTLIRMLLGMIRPDGGEVRLFGQKVNRSFNAWNQVGYLVETPYAYPNLSVLENLKVYYHLRQLKDPGLIDRIIEKLKLNPYRYKKAAQLSLGNQQRLGLAKALMHEPKLLILDEPMNGLDPEGIVEVRQLLRELVSTGSTVFLSSHLLSEMAKVASRVAIIHQGRLVKEISTHDLAKQLIQKVLVDTRDNPRAVAYLAEAGTEASLNSEQEIEILDEKAIRNPEMITKLLAEKGLPPRQVYTFTEDLESYFLHTIKP
ncbi:ABC transporter ATP-binding protein [Salmonirosea aquatica]|uniref:ATP-binding cassette domain-containing protein n=1 Tax=Salmonirosea aquatica TaxID=2654236 RepID=A0A7C9F8A8_9BACT|nr:ATP-binding cassette domain-containing protein [Cytophagaceae bacterium SJW1-29]